MFCIELDELEVLASCVGCPLPGLGDFVLQDLAVFHYVSTKELLRFIRLF